MLSKFRKSQQGFTLIELLIVVAIIGILAAIAIPQFAAYRIRGYNSAATSDLRNMRTTQEAMFSDYQSYGNFAAQGGTGSATAALWDPAANFVATQNANEELPFTPSNGVNIGISLVQSVAAAPLDDFTSYVVVAKHLNGDRRYGVDTDDVAIYFTVGPAPATPITTAEVEAATVDNNDLAGWTQM
jgi:type IV pilus assembly protein PilA